jgi:type IV pilus assembly protein PilV
VLPPARVVVCRDATPWDAGKGAYKWTCDTTSSGAALVIKIGWQAKNPDGSLIRDTNRQFPPSLALSVAPYTK